MRQGEAAPSSVLGWWWRFALAFWLLNTLLTFENRLIGFGVAYVPRLSFELCLAVVALMGWVAWRGRLSHRWGTVAAVGLTALVLVRYASVTAPAVLGRPVNVYWDGRHANELLRVAVQSVPLWQAAAAVLVLAIGLLLLVGVARWAIQTLGECLVWERPRPWMLTGVGALTLSFAAYLPDERDTRWFFSIPLTPTLLHQGQYLASMRYQYAWMSDYVRHRAPRPMVMVIVGDHQPPALVSGKGASWDVPVHVISDDPAWLQRLLGSRFVPGLTPPNEALGPMSALTSVLLEAFDAPGKHETLGVEHVVGHSTKHMGHAQDANTMPGRSVPGS